MKLQRFFAILVNRISALLGIVALLGLFSTTAMAAPAAGNAMVRVVHASPEAGTVDVFVDGTSLLTNFAFSTVTDYVPVPAGSHEIKVAPAGKGAGAAVITQSVSVNAGMAYTVAALGTKADGFSLKAFVDDNMLSGAMVKVRVYHLSPNAGPVDVAAGDKKVITALNYQSASDYLSVPAGSYTFNVTATTANATIPVPATLNAGTVNSVFAVGLYKGDPTLKFVAASVNGTPSMPNTGSDPMLASNTNNALSSLVLGFVAVLLLIGTGVATARFATTHRK